MQYGYVFFEKGIHSRHSIQRDLGQSPRKKLGNFWEFLC